MALPHLFHQAKVQHGKAGANEYSVVLLSRTIARYKEPAAARVTARLLELLLRRLSVAEPWEAAPFQQALSDWMSRAAVGGSTFMLPPANLA